MGVCEEEVLCGPGAPVQLVDHLHLPAPEERRLAEGAQPVAHNVQYHFAAVVVADGRGVCGKGAGDYVHHRRLPDAGSAEEDESPTDSPELWDQTAGTGWKAPEIDLGDGRTLVLEFT